MEFFELPGDRKVYVGSDVIDFVAKHKGIPTSEAKSLIVNGEMISVSDFMRHPQIIGKSFGEIILLKFVSPDRRVQCGKFFNPGMIVAIKEPNDFEKSKAGQRWKKLAEQFGTAP
jgi:hypothetical protein